MGTHDGHDGLIEVFGIEVDHMLPGFFHEYVCKDRYP